LGGFSLFPTVRIVLRVIRWRVRALERLGMTTTDQGWIPQTVAMRDPRGTPDPVAARFCGVVGPGILVAG
jgi:hypothetical protein